MERSQMQHSSQREVARALGDEARKLFQRINDLQVPDDLREKLEEVKHRLATLMDVMHNDGADGIGCGSSATAETGSISRS
jgi:hypothetical protein